LKPAETREQFYVLIRFTFRKTAVSVVNPRDITTIEYLMRKSTKQVEGWEDKSVKDCMVGADAKSFGAGRRTMMAGLR
jgi:succinate dehydrogenase assembly factor 1